MKTQKTTRILTAHDYVGSRLVSSLMSNLRRVVFFVSVTVLVSLVNAQPSTSIDLGELFDSPETWQLNAEAFMGVCQPLGFRFVDGHKTLMSSEKALLQYYGMTVQEARVYFVVKRLERVELSLYNKGDASSIDQASFEAQALAVKKKIMATRNDSGMTGKPSNDRANYIVKRHQWLRQTPGVQLSWACVEPHRSGGQNIPYSAEFINVLLVPIQEGNSGMTAISGGMSATRAKNARTILEEVTRSPSGDVWIEHVPMVDQGQKGYCAAATSERVLRYYGLPINQHQIAQLADTAATGGTTLEGMTLAIAKIGRQFQLDKKELIAPDNQPDFERSDHLKLIEQYNASARKANAPEIDWKSYLTDNRVDLVAIWRDMNPDILLAARKQQRQDRERFVKYIKTYIDQGVPLLWSCLVGFYPEEPPLGENGVFGHVRLIIGYNQKTDTILYSDSWGPNHVLKRLPLDHAWAMTKGLIVLKPRGVR